MARDEVTTESLREERRTADQIYGVIVAAAVLASVQDDDVWHVAVAVLVTLVIYWAAERYAVLMARRLVRGRRLSWSAMGRELTRGWELVTASFLPLGVLLVASVLGASVGAAVVCALICSTALLAHSGWRVGREAGLGVWQRIGSALLAGAFGAAMIALKAVLH